MADDGDAERFDELEDAGDLGGKVFRRLAASALVGGVEVVAEGVAGSVNGDGDVVWLELPQELEQHGGEAEDGVGGLAGDGGAHAAADGVVGAEDLGESVDEVERLRHGCPSLSHGVPWTVALGISDVGTGSAVGGC